MKFLIISNDYEVYSTLTEIIKDKNWGEVIKNNFKSNNYLLDYNEIDILIIDLLSSTNHCLQTLHDLIDSFKGKIIIISQIKNKETIAQTYFWGAEYYIVKPIHRPEILEILKKVIKLIQFENYIRNVKNRLKIF